MYSRHGGGHRDMTEVPRLHQLAAISIWSSIQNGLRARSEQAWDYVEDIKIINETAGKAASQ